MTLQSAWRTYRRWWLDFEVSAVKLALFRVLFFAVLGLDAWLSVAHAPRYGAGGFNVSHLPALDALLPTPGRTFMLVLFLTQATLAFRIAFGGASRIGAGVLAALYGAGYFVSQLDSYQHHYLVFLLVLLACFLPFDVREGRTRAWAVRLILVQISLLYLWAAISKLDPLWLDGRTLAVQIRVDWVRDLVEQVFGEPLGRGDFGGWAAMAKLILLVEVFLALALHIPLLRGAALAVGPLFHVSVELAGFQIGVFSYFMIALYVLLLPEAWLERASGWARERLEGIATWWRRSHEALAPRRYALGVTAAGSVLLLALPWSAEVGYAAALVFGVSALEIARRRQVAFPHLLACAALLALFGVHEEPARDHYRYWGGSQRRLGDQEGATRVYEEVARRWPDYAPGHTSLANLYRRAADHDRALEAYRRAQELAPLDDRPHLGEAMTHQLAGRPEEAAEAARRARWRAYLGAEQTRMQRAEAILRSGSRR